jgi:NAD(P)-dependent dehydrogenase (short-subunit alcohol dehydrogenase family)
VAEPAGVTIVTGASRGIGAATAEHLAAAGHDIVVNYRDDHDAARRVVATVMAQGRRAVAIQADVSRDDEVDQLFRLAGHELGPVTGLVNNAGLTAHIGDLAATPVDVIRAVVDVNLLGVILCARRAVLAMSTRLGGRGGAIVNISSGAATLGSAHEYVHYAAAKAGVDALTVGLAKEVGAEGIRVNAVAPGTIRTGIHAAAGDPGRADRVAGLVPLGRAGEPTEIAAAVGWLLSDEASYVTGTILRVAGGR